MLFFHFFTSGSPFIPFLCGFDLKSKSKSKSKSRRISDISLSTALLVGHTIE